MIHAASGLNSIQSSVMPLMRAKGFRKRGHLFNRNVNDGIVHVLNFQADRYPPGMWSTFCVNLGVFIPEVFALEHKVYERKYKPPVFPLIDPYSCSLKKRLGRIVTECTEKEGRDLWWSCVKNVEVTADKFPSLIEKFALPFFAKFDSRQSILNEWEAQGDLPVFSNGCGVAPAAMLAGMLFHFENRRRDALVAFHTAHDSALYNFKNDVALTAIELGLATRKNDA